MPVVIVNEAFATKFLTGVDPVGQRVLMSPFVVGASGPPPAPIAWEIVGVQANAANAGPGRPPFPEIAVPFRQSPWPRTIVAVRTSAGAAVEMAIADIVRQIDPALPMANVRTIEQTLSQSVASDRFYTVFFATFAAVALLLAAVGIYGVMSFVVVQRTHGDRTADGAGRTAGQVVAQILREGMGTALAGTVLGAAGAAFIGRALGDGLRRQHHGIR